MKSKFLNIILAAAVISFVASSCKKDETEPTPVPQIEFVSITPTTVTEYVDSINIVISYSDYDGDLGENIDSVKNMFVTDSRNAVVYEYRINQLAPSGSNIHIKGSLNTIIKNTAITDNSNSQTVSYSIYVKDRAGNQSNVVSTSAITVVK